MKYLIGVDAGTTSFKAALCSSEGEELALARKEYTLLASGERVEYYPEEYWKLFCEVIDDLFAQVKIAKDDVASIAISSQGETLICVDSEGNPLGNSIVWIDNRSVKECEAFRKRFSPEEIYSHTGQCEIEPTWTATKIMWIKNNEPERYEKTAKFLLLEDYLLYRLTGKFVCERVLLASTLLYDMQSGKWWDEMLSFIGLPESKLPEIMDSAKAVGILSEKAQKDTKLSPKTVAVTGALDQVAAMVGSGNITPGKVTEVTGSCLVVETVAGSIPKYEKGQSITCQPFCAPGSYLLLMFSNTAGMAFKWFRDSFYPDGTIGYAELAAEAENILPGSDGLIMLPHLTGAQFPRFNPDAKGVFYGATLSHGRGHFVRAILESVAYLERSMIEELKKWGYNTSDITVLGGGAGNSMWNEIKANVVDQCISTTKVKEPASVGAAMLSGVGSGVFKSLEEACETFAKPGDSFYPATETAKTYNTKYYEFLRINESAENLSKL